MLEFKSQSVLSLLDKASLYPIDMELKDRLKQARKNAGLTQREVAAHFQIEPQSISAWERGESKPEADKFLPLAKLYKADVAWLHGELAGAPAPDTVVDQQQTRSPIPRDQLQVPGVPDFKIYASAEGGPGQIIRSLDPVDFQPRPAILAHVRDAYGLIVTGDSMEPEFRSGDTALINPHLPAIGGEVYVFYAEQEGEARATIKHLRRVLGDKWLVSQHNPAPGQQKDFTLSRREWQWAHRVLGKYSRR